MEGFVKLGNTYNKGILRLANIFFAMLYMVVYTTPFFRYALGSRFRIIGLGLLALWFFSLILRVRPRYISKFCAVVLANVVIFVLMALVNIGNVREIIAGYVAFWSFVFIFEFYLILEDYDAIRLITITLIVVICITGLTTIIASIEYPNISKNTYKDSETGNNIANSLNVGGFDYIAGLSIIAPAFMYLLFIKKKKIFIIPLLICVVATFMSGLTIDFIVLIVGIVMFICSDQKMKLSAGRMILVVITITIVIFLIKNSRVLMTTITNGNEHLGNRIAELQAMLNGKLDDGTDLSYRIELYLRSLNTFFENPICGVGPYYYGGVDGLGNHSQVLDDFGRFGLIAVFAYVITIKCFCERLVLLRHVSHQEFSLMIPYCQFMLLSFLNPTLILPILGLVLFFILPGIYFVYYK